MTTLLEAKDVSKTYGRQGLLRKGTSQQVLHDIDFSVHAGESVALLGRSGSGKSTLIRQLLGLERPTAGQVLFQGRDVRQFSKQDWLSFRRSTQMVFQDSTSAVNPRHSIGRIVAEPLRHLTNLNEGGRKEKVASLLMSVGLQETDAQKLPGQMSGGQLQRVCIARAMATDPALLILDEAVSNLDILLQVQIIDLIRTMRATTNMALVFITHDLRLVRLLCERVVVLDHGRVVEEAPIQSGLHLKSSEGMALQQAVLSARPTAAPKQASDALQHL
jgi:nickel transport system ATP-binding protein